MNHDSIYLYGKVRATACVGAIVRGGCECCEQSRQWSQSSNEQSKSNNRAISVDQSLIMHKKAAESQKHRQFASARATYVLAAAVLSTREQSTTPSCDSQLSPLDARKLRCLGQASPRSAPWRRAMRSTCRLPRHPHPAGGL